MLKKIILLIALALTPCMSQASASGLEAAAASMKLLYLTAEAGSAAKKMDWRPSAWKRRIANNKGKTFLWCAGAVALFYGVQWVFKWAGEHGSLAEKVRDLYAKKKSPLGSIKNLKKPEDIGRCDRFGKTARDYAKEHNDQALLQEIDAAEKGERESLATQVRKAYDEVSEQNLPKLKAGLFYKNNLDPSLLQQNCCKNKDVNMPDMFGKTALDYATDHPNQDKEFIKALLKIEGITFEGKCCMDIERVLGSSVVSDKKQSRNSYYAFAEWLQNNCAQSAFQSYLDTYKKTSLEDFKTKKK